MTTLTDDTTAELAENNLVAVAEADWNAVHEQIDDLESDLAEYQDHTGREFADVRSRITEVERTANAANQQFEAHSGGKNPTQETGEQGATNDHTPLETIVRLPEHLAARELSANQERARFIAKDVRDYAEKCRAGLVIDSRAIKRVITASEGKRPHTQTVARVMEFLDDLGKDGVELTKRRGRKLVVFDSEVGDRLTHHSRCDQGGGPRPDETVISG